MFCNNPREHRDQGESDFNQRGCYDSEKYHDHHFNECNIEYKAGYDYAEYQHNLRREEEHERELRNQHELRLERDYRAFQEEQEMLYYQQLDEEQLYLQKELEVQQYYQFFKN